MFYNASERTRVRITPRIAGRPATDADVKALAHLLIHGALPPHIVPRLLAEGSLTQEQVDYIVTYVEANAPDPRANGGELREALKAAEADQSTAFFELLDARAALRQAQHHGTARVPALAVRVARARAKWLAACKALDDLLEEIAEQDGA